jgi:hypothetical protein
MGFGKRFYRYWLMDKKTLVLLPILLVAFLFPLFSAIGAPAYFFPDQIIKRTWDDSSSWFDGFNSQHPRWNWSYLVGEAGREIGPLPDGSTGVKIWVAEEAVEGEYSDCSLHLLEDTYRQGVVEMRLSLSDDNGISGNGRGTRGWGFWDANLERIDAAWFWSASSESSQPLTGLRAMVIREGVLVYNQPLDIDMREWHTYRVELRETGTAFFVDGEEVGSTPLRPANPQRVELWVDNMAVEVHLEGYTLHYLDLDHDQFMYIDWVRFRTISTNLFSNYLPIIKSLLLLSP